MSVLGRRISPAMVLALVALFFAVGGSAFAVGRRVVPQARCANGAVRGFAVVTGNPSQGITNLPQTFVSGAPYFKASFNCTGKAVQVRRQGDVFYVLFPGNTGKVAVANVITGADPRPVAVEGPGPDGSFKVTIPEANTPNGLGTDIPWEIVLV
jgi:hypothetical protein